MADNLLQRRAIVDWNKLTKEQREAIIKNATSVQLFGEFIDDEPTALSNSGKRGVVREADKFIKLIKDGK